MATSFYKPRRSGFAPQKPAQILPTAAPAGALDYRYGLYFTLHVAGFLTVTLLMTMGVFVLIFLALGGFSLDGMMHHLANLSTRYVAADAERLASFKWMVSCAYMLFAVAIIFFRRHAMLPAMPQRATPVPQRATELTSIVGGKANG